MGSHARATMDPDADTPLDRLVHATQAAVRAEHGRSTPDIDRLVHEATRGVVFRFHLALRISDVTDRVQERAELVLLVLTMMLNLPCHRPSRAAPHRAPP